MKWLITFCVAVLLGAHGAHAADRLEFYQVKLGDTLSARFGKTAAVSVCELNVELERIKNCHDIKAGQWLQLPPNVSGNKIVRKNVSAPATTASTKSGVFRWVKVGGAPLYGCGKREEGLINDEAWQKIGLTDEEQSELRQMVSSQQHRNTYFQPGDRFEAVAFCRAGQVAFERNVLGAWQKDVVVLARTYVLKSGRVLHWVRNCNNWVVGKPLPPVAEPPDEVTPPAGTPAEPPVAATPPALADEPPASELQPVLPQPEEEKSSCLLDPKMYLGQEHEPEHDGNDADSSNLAAALYCTWRGEGGTHGLGFGFQGSWWNGHVNFGSGKFQGRMLAFGPGYEYIADNGWNLEGKLLLGRIHENFSQAQYQSSRTIDIIGPAVSLNLGQRRDRGEKLLPETRLFGMWGLPTSVKAGHSNFGQSIADIKELSRFGSYLSLGVHQDVYDFESFTLWARVGYFRESPVAESMNFRIGISDPYRVCGVGVGVDLDLMNSGEALGWGWWCDIVKGTQVVRSEYRLRQIVKETGVTFQEDGTFMVPTRPIQPTN